MVYVDFYITVVAKVSKALCTLVARKKPSFKKTQLCIEDVSKAFHSVGLCTANARQPTVERWCRGTNIS